LFHDRGTASDTSSIGSGERKLVPKAGLYRAIM
jgi:hypothetical protein